MKPIIGILGPTAVGKSKLAISLAQKLNTEIISADSMQIYKKLNIGTAKPTAEELRLVKHHMIDVVEPTESFSSYLFKSETQKILYDFEKRGLIPLIVGGTGFFFKNLIYKFDFEDGNEDKTIRKSLIEQQKERGNEYIMQLLREVDPESAAIIHPNDTKKAMRAIEIFYSTGRKKSSGKNLQEPRYEYLLFVLNRDREKLYQSINERVDAMMKDGLVDEVRSLSQTLPSDAQCMQGIGYKELLPYFKGESTLQEATDLIKQHSRNYAKRQITFYKKMDAVWLDADKTTDELIDDIKTSYFDKFNIKI